MHKSVTEYIDQAKKSADVMVLIHDIEIRNTVEAIISKEGYNFESSTFDKSALRNIKSKRPDLILLDNSLPDIDSHNLFDRLKEDIQVNNIPIIFITDNDDKQILSKYIHAEEIDFIYKPLREEELILRIETRLAWNSTAKQEKTSKEEKRYRQFFYNNPDPIYVWQHVDNDFVLHDYNKAAVSFTDGKIENLQGIKATDLYEEENQQVLETLNYCLEHKTNTKQEIDYRMKTSDKPLYLNVNYTYISPNLIMIQTEDLTKRRQIELELKQSNQLLKSSQKIARVGAWEYDIATNHLYWTDEVYHIHDTSASEFTPTLKDGLSYFLPESRTIISKALKLAIEQGENYDLELEKYTLKGRRIYVRLTCRVTLEKGTPIKLTGVIQDITESKKIEKNLKESQERFSKAFDNNSVPSSILNIKTEKRLAVNKSYCKVFGYSKSELLKNGLKNNLAGDQQEYKNCIKKLLKEGRLQDFPCRMLTKSGETKHTLVNSTKLYPDNDDIFITSYLDITDRKKTIEALKKSEEHLRAIVENSLNAIIVADDSGNYTSANPAAVKMFGYSLDKLLEMNVSQIKSNNGEDNMDKYREYLKKGMEIGEFEFIRSDGQKRVALYHAVRVRENFNLSILSDITENKKAELNLNETLQQLNLAIDTAQLGIWVLTLETGENIWNDKMLDIYGLSREEFEEDLEGWKKLVHPEDNDYANSRLKEAFEKKSVFDVNFRIIRPSGEIRYLEASASPILDDNGELIKIMGINLDVTDRILAVRKLKESQEKFKTLFENAVDIVSLVDRDGNIIDMNRTDPVYKKEEVVGSNVKYWLNDEMKAKYTNLVRKAFETGEVQSFEPIIIDPTGKKRQWYYRISALDQNMGKEKLIITFSEITEQKRVEAELKEYRLSLEEKVRLRTAELQVANAQLVSAQKEIEAAFEKEKELSELKSRFIATASHQFRTPLTVIRSNAELMESSIPSVNENRRKLFEKATFRIKSETKRMTDLMNDILILGKINANASKPRKELIDIVDISRDIVDRLNEVEGVKAKIQMVVINEPRELLLDESHFNHIMVNILRNAQKYSLNREDVDFKIHFHESKVEFLVKDKGIGISMEDQKNLFQPFFRGQNTEGIQGTGLGLSIAYEYVTLNDGEIKVSSQLNVGTTIELIFYQ